MFTLNQNNKVVIEPKMLLVPAFKTIWDRDLSKTKTRATKEFAFVYFDADYQSEYNTYGIEKRVYIARDIMGDETYTPDLVIENAIEKYQAMQQTASMRYLKSVRKTVDSLIAFHDDLRYEKSKSETLKYDPTATMRAMKDVESIMEQLEKWEKKVYSEEDDMQIRGGGEVGLFEDKDSAPWLHKN